MGAVLPQAKEVPDAGERAEPDPSQALSEGIRYGLGLGLLASTTGGQHISVVEATQF